MASLDEERYLRHLWLLGEGGLFVLRGVVSREATKSGSTLDTLLHNGRAQFTGVLQEQQNCLFPTPTTVNADTNTWDMSILFVVLKKLFWSNLSLSERASLSALKTYRNDFQGHPIVLSMNASEYSSNRQLLEQTLRHIASGINENVNIENVIQKTASDRIDAQSIFNHFREIHDFNTIFLEALEDRLQRVNLNISSIQGNQEMILQKLTNLQIKHLRRAKHKYSQELKTIIQTECENEEKQRKANNLLFEFVEIIQSDTKIHSDEIRRNIALRVEWYGEITLKLIDDLIAWFSDIEDRSNGIGNAHLGSIVLPIFHSSVTGILTFFKYMNDSQCKQCLSIISSNASVLLGFPCSLSWKVEPLSLRIALSSSCKYYVEKGDFVFYIKQELSRNYDVRKRFLKHAGCIERLLKKSADDQSSDKEQTKPTERKIAIPVSDEGCMERLLNQPTNDQSSDKEQTKPTERKIALPVSDEGCIERLLNKSTDDQSSDKEQTERKFAFPVSDEGSLSMADVSKVQDNNLKENVNWVKSVLALKITLDDVTAYSAKSIIKQSCGSLTYSEQNNLRNLLNFVQNRQKRYTIRENKYHDEWVEISPEIEYLLKKFISAHWNTTNVGWENESNVYLEVYSKIINLYQPFPYMYSNCPADIDMLAILCVFGEFKVEYYLKERNEINQMMCHVSFLLHTPDNKISERKMSEILEDIYKFIESTNLSKNFKSKTKDKLQKVQLISNANWYLWYRRAVFIQKFSLAVELDRTKEFLNITEKLLDEFNKNNRFKQPLFNVSNELDERVTGGLIGPFPGLFRLVWGLISGAAIAASRFLWTYLQDVSDSKPDKTKQNARIINKYCRDQPAKPLTEDELKLYFE